MKFIFPEHHNNEQFEEGREPGIQTPQQSNVGIWFTEIKW